MKTIAITNHKGGVGKSGLTVCLAGALREAGRNVLVMDLDQQATSTEWLGLRHPGELVDEEPFGGSLRDTVASASSISHLVLQSLCGVDVVPSGSGFASFDQAVAGTIAAERLLTRSLSGLTSDWDYVLIDCPPSLGLVTVNALVAADALLVPVEPKSASRTPILTILQLAREVQAQLNPRLELLGIVASRFQPRLQHRQVDAWLRANFGDQVFDSVIRESTHVSESHAYQLPVTRYMPKCNGSSDFKALCSEFLSRVEKSHQGLREVRIHG
jgi:chromosome partitioning protein